MSSPAASSQDSRGPLVRFTQGLHRFFLLAPLAVYALAAVPCRVRAPMREVAVTLPGGSQERISMLLLAVLLFCAAAVIRWSQFHDVLERPSLVVAGLVASWLGPALLVILAGTIMPRLAGGESTAGILVGLALVAAMPVANSSAGWTQNTGGNVALCLGLIVLSILLSPLVTPSLLKLMGLAPWGEDTARIEKVVTQFSGWRFILWVILPSLGGAAAAWVAGANWRDRAKPLFRLIALVDILLLNYINASAAVAEIWDNHQWGAVAVAGVLATIACLVGVAALALVQSRVAGVSRPVRTAPLFSLSMKHTGLALVLAGEILGNQPRVILVILLTTLAQHVVAAAVDWRLQRGGH